MDYKKKVNNMLEAIDEAAGTTYKKDRQMILQAKIDVESWIIFTFNLLI